MASWQMCWHRANTFVLVFRIVNTSGHAGFASTTGLLWLSFEWLLVWVVFLPLLNRNPWLRTTQVLSGAYHAHTHSFPTRRSSDLLIELEVKARCGSGSGSGKSKQGVEVEGEVESQSEVWKWKGPRHLTIKVRKLANSYLRK